MAWYFIVDTYIGNSGRGEYDEYIEAVRPIVESYGGKYIVRTENILSLNKDRNPQRSIVIRFEQKKDIEDCFSSSEYLAIAAKRINSVDSRAIIVDGMEVE